MDPERSKAIVAWLRELNKRTTDLPEPEGYRLVIACNPDSMGELMQITEAGEFSFTEFAPKKETADKITESWFRRALGMK